MTLILPLFTFTAQLLFDTFDYPMTLLKSQIDSYLLSLSIFPVKRLCICPVAVSAPHLQSVPLGAICAKFTLAFPFFAFGAVFLPTASNRAMCFPVLVVPLGHYFLIPRSQPSFNMFYFDLFHLHYPTYFGLNRQRFPFPASTISDKSQGKYVFTTIDSVSEKW